jgi:hypothetical protein
MRKFAKFLENCLKFYSNFGWIGVYAIFLPVYFEQDSSFINYGRDILSIKKTTRCYFKGTWKQRDKWFDSKF